MCESCSVVSKSLRPRGLYSPWDSPGQNTGVSSLSRLQGIFSIQGSNPGLPHCRRILYQLSPQGSPRILEWVAYPFSSGSSCPRNRTGVSCMAGRFFTNWATGEAPESLLNLWQCRFCLIFFYFFDLQACGISAPQPDFKPIAPASEGEVLTIGLPGKSLPSTFKPCSLSTSSLMVFFILAVLSTASNQGCPPQMDTSLISLVSVFNLCCGAENTQVCLICLLFLFRSTPLLCSILFLSREENAFRLKKKKRIVTSTCLLYRKGINRCYKAAQCGQLNSPRPIAQLVTET